MGIGHFSEGDITYLFCMSWLHFHIITTHYEFDECYISFLPLSLGKTLQNFDKNMPGYRLI